MLIGFDVLLPETEQDSECRRPQYAPHIYLLSSLVVLFQMPTGVCALDLLSASPVGRTPHLHPSRLASRFRPGAEGPI